MTSRRRKAERRHSFWVGIMAASLIAMLIALIISLALRSGAKDITPFNAGLQESLEQCLTDKAKYEVCVIEYTFQGKGEKAKTEVLRVAR